ncbi:DUF6966 domain-containing protein [Aeromonas salmonicida]|jgi:hypothetical protein|uniref:DUF6966 domain-containing protein n=1 Tax=Aeromonas salmonicida TaxID=645 RepID=UPI00232A8A76|nr:hypothetical protein [Aeromonas salmonicida]WCH21106.1 hypothetical protein ONZ54_13190 [Aeromonas salmonicida]
MNEAIELLQSVKEKHWITWLAYDAALIEKQDFRGIEHLLSAFGGMGSINDLVIHPINGHEVQDSTVDKTNRMLQKILGEIWSLAKQLYNDELQVK